MESNIERGYVDRYMVSLSLSIRTFGDMYCSTTSIQSLSQLKADVKVLRI